jgi:hypothetical protein
MEVEEAYDRWRRGYMARLWLALGSFFSSDGANYV